MSVSELRQHLDLIPELLCALIGICFQPLYGDSLRSKIIFHLNPFSSDTAGSFNHHGMRYSTTVPNYPDTHEDFMPTNKLQNSDLSLKDIVEQDVNDNPVTIYMKGVPDLPRCGFSSLAQLAHVSTDIHQGEFVGGSDIILNMHQTGELKEMLKDIAANLEN
ncbi:monothiol glutaredoxin-S15, mitochondrial-like [Camellia sinensis]|uniref:monothiol glutaredoxin-S15, mitochondrial-like n=1 Tax=Camellia sinensis TaxID=4442 RepID=UPI001035809F|nr:monothiol glutaredoxin-S15, mitochondrial-like [Camellia sinensis]